MSNFIGLAVGLIIVGLVAAWLGDSAVPMVVVILAIWGASAFLDGFTKGKR